MDCSLGSVQSEGDEGEELAFKRGEVWMWCGNEKCADGESEELRVVTLWLINEDLPVVLLKNIIVGTFFII